MRDARHAGRSSIVMNVTAKRGQRGDVAGAVMEGVARRWGSRRTMENTTAQKEARPSKTIACPQTILAQYERIGRLFRTMAAILPCQTAAGKHRGVASFLNRPVWSRPPQPPHPRLGYTARRATEVRGQSAEAGSALISFTGRGVARRPRIGRRLRRRRPRRQDHY